MCEEPLRILLIDDEEDVREPLAKYLRRELGYQVDTAGDAKTALELLDGADGNYDVALIDDLLAPAPGQDPEPMGVTLTKEFKIRYPRVEIIVFTGRGMKSALETLRAGAYRYLTKPLNLDELEMLIQTAVEHRRLKGIAREKQILEQLMETSTALLSGQNLQEILDTILLGVQAIGFDRVCLYLLSKERQTMQGKAEVNVGEQFVGHSRPVATDPQMIALMADRRPGIFEREIDEPLPFEKELAREGVTQWACVPLILEGEVIGKLSIDNKDSRRPIEESELESVALFASQAAAAIENARLYKAVAVERDRSKAQAEQLMALVEITKKMQSELELPSLLNLISQQAVELLDADSGGILLLDDEGQHLTFKGSFGLGRKIVKGTRDTVGSSIAGRVVKQRSAIIANDIPNDPRFENPAADLEGFLAIISTPLWVGGEIIGTLDVHSKSDRQAFDQSDLQILSLMASQAAVAIENARLLEETQQRADQLETLNQITALINAALDINGILEVALREGLQAIRAYTGTIMLVNPLTNRFEIKARINQGEFLLDETDWKWGLGEGIAGYVTETGIPYNCPDITEDSRFVGVVTLRNYHSLLCVPIISHGRVLGVINAKSKGRNFFKSDDLQILSTLANHAAIALESQRLRDLGLVLPTLSLDEMLAKIIENAYVLLGTGLEFSSICLMDDENDEGTYGIRFPPGNERIFKPRKDGLTAAIIKSGDAEIVEDVQQDPRVREFAKEKGVKSILGVPLEVRAESGGSSRIKRIGALFINSTQEREFNDRDRELLQSLANQAAIAIENTHLYQKTERRRQLLAALDEASRHIRAAKETPKLQQEIVRLATELLDCTTGGLYINYPHLEELELLVAYELQPDLIGSRVSHSDGLVGLVARTGQAEIIYNFTSWPNSENGLESYNFKTALAVPLKQQIGEVEAVLFVADNLGVRQFTEADLEILERFAVQSSIALQTSRLLGQEERMVGQLVVLHKISDYIQAARDLDKILHVVLTGITAGYGLGFNRAALLLLDAKRENLIGRLGIGHLDEAKAREDWARDQQNGLDDFKRYLDLLERDELRTLPVEENVRKLRLSMNGPKNADVFSRVVIEGQFVLVTQPELEKLPNSFTEVFEPALPLIVVPLIAREQVIGLLVADNKFTRSPITSEDIEALLTFANTAAIAIANTQLFDEMKVARERLRSSYEASNAFVLSKDPEQVLRDIVERACIAANATGVNMMMIDQGAQAQYLITAGRKEQFDIRDLLQPDGISMKVIRTGKPEKFEDTRKSLGSDKDHIFWRTAAAALCLPVFVEGTGIGVMWLHYDQPHYFSEAEIEALQFYVNQAAIAYDSARRIKELRFMHRAAEALSRVVKLQDVLRQIVQNACKVLEAESASVSSYDPSKQMFTLVNSVATDTIPFEIWRDFCTEGLWYSKIDAEVLERGWVGVEDVENRDKSDLIEEQYQSFYRQIETRSFQGVALAVNDEKLGILYVNYDRPRTFSNQDQEFVKTFANHAALALKKANLLDQVDRVRNTAYIVAEVTALEHLNNTLRSVVDGTVAVVNCDAVTLYVYDPDKNKLGSPPTMFGVRYEEETYRFPEVPSDSIVVKMLKQDHPYIVEDTANDPDFKNRRFTIDEDVVSCAAIPLKVGEHKVGIMFVNCRQSHHFTDEELTNIELFSHQAAVAIRNTQLYEQVQEQAGALRALYQASQMVTSSLDLDDILKHIVEQAPRVIRRGKKQLSWACMRLVKDEKSWVVAAYPHEKLRQIQDLGGGEIDLRVGRNGRIGIMGRAAITKAPQLVGDVSVDPDYLGCNPKTKSELAVPIKLGDEVIGVINLEHPDYNAFNEVDQQSLESLAAQAAVAIQNAHLFEQTQRRAQLLDIAARIARNATAILDIDELLSETTRLISRYFDVYHTAVFLLDRKKEYAVLEAAYPKDDKRLFEPGHKLKVGEEGIVGWVAHSSKPHLAPNVHNDDFYVANLPDTQAEMAFPLITRGQVIGVLDAQSTTVAKWRDEDIATLETMADQLANAIDNAWLYQDATERLDEVNALHQAAVALAGAFELEEVLKVIIYEAMHLTNSKESSVLFWDAQAEKFTRALRINSEGLVEWYTSRARAQGGRARQIIDEQRTIVIPDIQQETDFNPVFIEKGYRASLGTPLLSRREAIGVLYARDTDPRSFSERQITLFEGLASVAAVAIDRARQYEEMKEIKGYIGAHTAVDWLKMVSTAWGHNIRREVGTALGRTALLQNLLSIEGLTPDVREELDQLKDVINRIKKIPITAPLSYEDAIDSVRINKVVKTYLDRQWTHDRYKSVDLHYDLQEDLDHKATVWASREWLRRGLELVVDNAVWAMHKAGCPKPQISVTTRLIDNLVEIFLADTGPGIPEQILAKLFKKPIPKPEGSRGSGIGLMLAQTIFQTYRGNIRVESTGDAGTTMVIVLPVEAQDEQKTAKDGD